MTFFETTKRKMTENNLQQSQIIEGGTPLPNRTGLALGTFYQMKSNAYILLPWPPSELKPMFIEQVRPLLEQQFPSEEKLISKVLSFYGIGESHLINNLKDLIATQINPTIAPYAKPNEVTLRLTVKTSDIHAGNQALQALEEKSKPVSVNIFMAMGMTIRCHKPSWISERTGEDRSQQLKV